MDCKSLESIEGVTVELNKDLSNYSTMKLRAYGDLITVTRDSSLSLVLKELSSFDLSPHVLGLGANQLLPERLRLPYLILKFPFDKSYLDSAREHYDLPASVKLSVLTSHAAKYGIKGWEVFTGIPATLGGAIFMNAGTNLGEIGPLVREVRIMTAKGHERVEKIGSDSFSYRKNNFLNRGEVIIGAVLTSKGQDSATSKVIKDYLAKRNKGQPMKEATCGCVFKNYERKTNDGKETCRAGQCIDNIGLKGFRYKNLRVSPVHANFIENLGGATAGDVVEFIEIIRQKVKEEFGFELETEVRIPKELND